MAALLWAVIEAKDTENAALRAELGVLRESFTALRGDLDAVLERERLLGLKAAELERRLGQDSTNSGTPGSKEGIGARERRKAERRKQASERATGQTPAARGAYFRYEDSLAGVPAGDGRGQARRRVGTNRVES